MRDALLQRASKQEQSFVAEDPAEGIASGKAREG
jgi:hypothetical protein